MTDKTKASDSSIPAGGNPAGGKATGGASGAATRGAIGIGALVIAAVLFFAVNILADRGLTSARLDLTEDKLFTLSEGTRKTLEQIQEPVTLRFYFSDRLGEELPDFGLYAQRVRDMLREFGSIAGDRLQVEMLSPEPFSDAEDRAVAFGLQGVPVDQSGEQVFFGIAGTNSTDDVATISWLRPERERFLEHDLTKMVHTLANPEKPTLGILSGLPIQGGMQMTPQGRPSRTQPWAIAGQLDELFETVDIEADVDRIDAEIDVLMVVHPQDLSQQTLYAIDQFVLRGGHAIVYVDPHSEIQQAMAGGNPMMQQQPTSSDLAPLFETWGVTYDPDMVAGDRRAARRVSTGGSGSMQAVDYVAWLALEPQNFNQDDLVTSELGKINMATSGFFKPAEGASTELSPLISTADLSSAAIEADTVRMFPQPEEILADFKPGDGALVLAARLRGTALSAFPDGPPPNPETEGEQAEGGSENAGGETEETEPLPPHIAESEQPLNVILVGDTDMLSDRQWAQTQSFFGQQITMPVADNGSFAINAVDNLTGSDALISLRSRGTVQRPFALIEEMRNQSEQQYRATERSLMEKLRETEKKLAELQTGEGGTGTSGNAILTAEQKEAIETFRAEVLDIREQLRDVQHALRSDINQLESRIRFANIWAMPIVVVLIAIVLGLVRLQRRRRAFAASDAA